MITIKTKQGDKFYVEVVERLKEFRAKYPDYGLISEILQNSEGRIIIKAIIVNGQGIMKATGLAFEDQNSSELNQSSYIENCETSAWGRALANFGIGLIGSVASADEVVAAIEQQKTKQKSEIPATPVNYAQTDEIEPPKKVTSTVLPALTPKQSQIISMVAAKYGEQCPDGFVVDTKKICAAIIKVFGKYPSQLKSIEKVLSQISVNEVTVKNDFIEGLTE